MNSDCLFRKAVSAGIMEGQGESIVVDQRNNMLGTPLAGPLGDDLVPQMIPVHWEHLPSRPAWRGGWRMHFYY
jgi:hypothetical protein